jgi:hypothetical protein
MEKPWWKSRSVWAAALFFGKSLLGDLGVPMPPVLDAILNTVSGVLGAVGVRGFVLGAGTGKSV